MPITLNDKFLSAVEAAKLLDVHERTVKRLIQKGQLVGYKVGAQWRIIPEDIRAYLEKNTQNR